jgi:hypothetical protein
MAINYEKEDKETAYFQREIEFNSASGERL